MFYFIFLLLVASAVSTDYPWCDFAGDIPSSAVVGGTTSNGSDIYIVQAYIPKEGLMLGGITSDSTDVYVQSRTIVHVQQEDRIKVLCSNEANNFAWMRTSGNTLQSDVEGKTPVIGGLENETKLNYIARREYQGEMYIGKVIAFGYYSGIFLAVDNNRELIQEGKDYEILLYTG